VENIFWTIKDLNLGFQKKHRRPPLPKTNKMVSFTSLKASISTFKCPKKISVVFGILGASKINVNRQFETFLSGFLPILNTQKSAVR